MTLEVIEDGTGLVEHWNVREFKIKYDDDGFLFIEVWGRKRGEK
jgi:hypothetical protein